jgi:hypothetical protein
MLFIPCHTTLIIIINYILYNIKKMGKKNSQIFREHAFGVKPGGGVDFV